MEQIWSLFTLLSEEQKSDLKSRCRKKNNAIEKLLLYLLDDEKDEKELIKKLKVTIASFSKIQTQAKDYLIAFIKQSLQNPYDDIQIVQLLLMKGEIKTATKLYNSLEKEYESKEKYQILDILYNEGFRIGQLKGDVKFLEEVTQKRSVSIAKYAAYVQLNGEIMIEMVRAEKFEERKEDIDSHLSKIKELHKRALANTNPILIHNTLLLLFHHYSRYFNEPDKTWDVVKKMDQNRIQNKDRFSAGTDSIVSLNMVHFLSFHEGYGSPEPLYTAILTRIEAGGRLAKINLYYVILAYYLSQLNIKMVIKYLDELERIEDRTHFAPFKNVVSAILAFIEKDYKTFHAELQLFYTNPDHISLPDSEVTVRILELLVLHKENEEWHYKSKIDALRMYMARNLNKTRYAEEFDILAYLTTASAKNRAKIELQKQSKYRNSRVLAAHVLDTIR
jgi:predicted RNA-binding protein with EMAP domain